MLYINYEYDQRGNLTGVAYPSMNSSALSDIEFSRDNNGRLRNIERTGDEVRLAEYSYSGLRVDELTFPQPGDESGVVIAHDYNGLGWLTEIEAVEGEANTQVHFKYTRYYYNKDSQILSEMDENANELRSFVYGRGIDEVLVMMDPNGADFYYLNDHLYSPAALVDEDGDVVE